MAEKEVIATERINKKEYRLILLPVLCLVFFVVLYMGYRWAIVYDGLYDIIFWLIWGPILLIMGLLFISLYNDAVIPLTLYEEGIQIHIIHIYPFAKRLIHFSEIQKIVAAEGPVGGFGFYIYLKNGKLIEDNNDIINIIESKTKDKFNWITNEERIQTKL